VEELPPARVDPGVGGLFSRSFTFWQFSSSLSVFGSYKERALFCPEDNAKNSHVASQKLSRSMLGEDKPIF